MQSQSLQVFATTVNFEFKVIDPHKLHCFNNLHIYLRACTEMQQSKNFHKSIEVFIHKTNCPFHFLLSLCGFEMSGNNNCSCLEANGSPAC